MIWRRKSEEEEQFRRLVLPELCCLLCEMLCEMLFTFHTGKMKDNISLVDLFVLVSLCALVIVGEHIIH